MYGGNRVNNRGIYLFREENWGSGEERGRKVSGTIKL
jgi:hypothetical protein